MIVAVEWARWAACLVFRADREAVWVEKVDSRAVRAVVRSVVVRVWRMSVGVALFLLGACVDVNGKKGGEEYHQKLGFWRAVEGEKELCPCGGGDASDLWILRASQLL